MALTPIGRRARFTGPPGIKRASAGGGAGVTAVTPGADGGTPLPSSDFLSVLIGQRTAIPNSQFPIPNAQSPTPNAHRTTPNAQRPTPNAQFPTPNAQRPTP